MVSNSRAFSARKLRASDISSLTVRMRASSASLSVRSDNATSRNRNASARLERMAISHKTAKNMAGVAQTLIRLIKDVPVTPALSNGIFVQTK